MPRTRHIAALRTCTTRERRTSTAQEATEREPRDQEDEGAAKVGGRAGERRGTVWRRKESGGRLGRMSAGVAEAPGGTPQWGGIHMSGAVLCPAHEPPNPPPHPPPPSPPSIGHAQFQPLSNMHPLADPASVSPPFSSLASCLLADTTPARRDLYYTSGHSLSTRTQSKVCG